MWPYCLQSVHFPAGDASFDAKESLWSYYQYASDYRKAGGLTGGCLVKILCPFIGVVGAYVVLVVLMVICVILITERSLLAPLGKGSKRRMQI